MPKSAVPHPAEDTTSAAVPAEPIPAGHVHAPAEEPVADELPTVTPQAPLDIRLREALTALLASRPRWNERPPSMAETWEYSNTGDWTADEKSLKRVVHGLCVLVAFVVTYPISWAAQAARQKPIGLVLAVAMLFLLGKVL